MLLGLQLFLFEITVVCSLLTMYFKLCVTRCDLLAIASSRLRVHIEQVNKVARFLFSIAVFKLMQNDFHRCINDSAEPMLSTSFFAYRWHMEWEMCLSVSCFSRDEPVVILWMNSWKKEVQRRALVIILGGMNIQGPSSSDYLLQAILWMYFWNNVFF